MQHPAAARALRPPPCGADTGRLRRRIPESFRGASDGIPPALVGGMYADAVARITRRHRFATAQDLTFALSVCGLFVLAVVHLFMPIVL